MSDIRIDHINAKLIRMLQNDARTSFKDIAKECNVSLDTIKNRYNILKKNGVIRGSTIVVDPKKMEQGILVIIGIQAIQQFSDSVLNMINKMQGVCIVTRSIGQYDIEAIFLLKDIEQIGIIKEKIEDLPQVEDANVGIFVDRPLLCPKNFEFD